MADTQPRTADWRSVLGRVRTLALSLPGKLLGLSVAFVLLAEILIFFPSIANFRTEWLKDRADAAYLAALAADAAMDSGSEMELSDRAMRELLAGAEAIQVARVTDGVNELVLPGQIGSSELHTANLIEESWLDAWIETCHAFLAPRGRYLSIIAEPRTLVKRPGVETDFIIVIVPEAGLKMALADYARNIFFLSLLIAGITGALLYVFLMFMLVGPMQRLGQAMIAFKDDPADPALMVTPSGRRDEIGEAEVALAAMQSDVRAAFAQRERLAALGGAVARINHDLRNVLASAQLVSDRLAISKDERIAAMGARLVRAVDRGIRLCQDTLEYGRSSERPPELREIALRGAVDDAAGDAFAATGAADWHNTIDEDLFVSADPDHLHRIVLNLARNAVQAMAGGEVSSLSVTAEREGDQVVLLITDTGPGVPERVRETLFEPFGLSGSKGSGLGLSIARELARTMGGDVALERTGEDGTVFKVTLNAA